MAVIDDIADEIGVSVSTVRNVLSGRNKEIWPSAKQRADQIRAAAAKRRYRMNTAARAIATGRFNNIALVLSHSDSSVHIFPETLVGVRAEAREAGRHIVLAELPAEAVCAENLPGVLRDLSVDGMLISCLDTDSAVVFKWVRHYHIPAIWMNMRLPADCVFPDDVYGGRRAAEHLIELGHRAILYIDDEWNRHYSRVDRMEGYIDVALAHGLQPNVVDCNIQPAGIAEILKSDNRPTAIISYGWEFAVKVYCVALAAGLSIPADLSLITFNSALVSVADRPIYTMGIPAWSMGVRAFSALQQKIAAPSVSIDPIGLSFEHLGGETCAAARKN